MSIIFALAMAGSAMPGDTPNWVYQRRHDEMTDQTGGMALVLSQDGKSGFGLTCEVADPDRLMTFRYSFPDSRRAPSKTIVQVRIDKRPLFEDEWFTVKNVAMAGYPDQVSKLIKELDGAQELMIRAHDYDGQPIDAKFNVEGASTAIRWVLQECGWPNYPKRQRRAP